ncbi:DUF2142 domain-containing protein [Cryobacterium breve]
MVAADRGNWTWDYPPVFYVVMGLFAGTEVLLSVLLMRVFDVCLFVGLSIAIFILLTQSRRPSLTWGFAIALVPLEMFIIPSTNPSSWAVISTGTLWISLLGFLETSGRRKFGLGTLAVVSTVIGVGARADAVPYSILAVCAFVAHSFTLDRRFIYCFVRPALLCRSGHRLGAPFHPESHERSNVVGGCSRPLGAGMA